MIFYFSGTGNSRWAARQLAALTGDQSQDITKLSKAPDLARQSQVGLVFPIYAWGVPEPVEQFAAALPRTEAFTFALGTCGSEAGYALKKLGRLYPLQSCYSLVMPNNYVVGSDLESPQQVRQILDQAKTRLKAMAEEILAHTPVYQVQEGSMPGLKSGVVNYGFNHFARSTKSFYATDRCVSCGLCAENCPAGTITLVQGKPVWSKACYQCMGCINRCPQQAIEYGKSTAGRGRYVIDRYLDGET